MNDWINRLLKRRSPPPQEYLPTTEPHVIWAAETGVMFYGHGRLSSAFQLDPEGVDEPRLLWQHQIYYQFIRWERYGNVVVLVADTELSAWDIKGQFLWKIDGKPDYEVETIKDKYALSVKEHGEPKLFSLKKGVGFPFDENLNETKIDLVPQPLVDNHVDNKEAGQKEVNQGDRQDEEQDTLHPENLKLENLKLETLKPETQRIETLKTGSSDVSVILPVAKANAGARKSKKRKRK